MSEAPIVTIQLGQCGNQVGAACFQQLSQQLLSNDDYDASSSSSSSSRGRPTRRRIELSSKRDGFQRAIAARFFRESASSSSSSSSSIDGIESAPLPIARAVLIDMEPKVIDSALAFGRSPSASFSYDARSSFSKQSGSGNNWSYGFGVHGPQSRTHMVARIRREVEMCDTQPSMLMHSSLAGGTGSGLSAFLAEVVHDEFEGATLVNQVVWPYKEGEVIVQNYNALLTLSHLHEFSDGLILFDNDSLHSICARRLHQTTPSFGQLNSVIGENLSHILLPCQTTQAQPMYRTGSQTKEETTVGANRRAALSSSSSSSSSSSKYYPPSDIDLLRSSPPLSLWHDPLSHLFAHPSFKLSTIHSIPQMSSQAKSFDACSWKYLMKHLAQMGLAGSSMEDGLDFQTKSEGMKLAAGPITKRKWHQHWSSSAKSSFLFDINTQHQLLLQHAADATSVMPINASSMDPAPPALSSSFLAPLDDPMPTPGYMDAFIDGESYLEYRITDELYDAAATSKAMQSGGSAGRVRSSSSVAPSSSSLPSARRTARSNSTSRSSATSASSSADAHSSDYNSTLSQILFLRGAAACSADATAFLDPSLYASFSLSPLLVARSPVVLHGDQRIAAAWSNSAAVARPIDEVVSKVSTMMSANAYVHHYEKYGIDREWMAEAKISLEQISQDYKGLAYK